MPVCRRCKKGVWPGDEIVMPGGDKWCRECAEYYHATHKTDRPLTANERKRARAARVCPRCGAHMTSWKEAEKHRC